MAVMMILFCYVKTSVGLHKSKVVHNSIAAVSSLGYDPHSDQRSARQHLQSAASATGKDLNTNQDMEMCLLILRHPYQCLGPLL